MKSYLKKELSIQCMKLNTQLTNMDVYEHRIPQVELDIFLRNIQDFYEKAVELKTAENNKAPSIMVKEIPSTKAIDQTNEPEKGTNIFDEETLRMAIAKDIKNTVNIEVEEDIFVEAIMKTENQEKKIEPISEEKIDEELSTESVAEIKQTPISETILDNDPSFNDLLEVNPSRDDLFSNVRANQEILDLNKKLAEARGNHSLAEKLQNQQIENLKSVIGINDKFYFINELFDGDSTKYEDVIYTLNNFKKFDDAMQYFSTLKYRFNWKEETEAPEILVKMLERKFDLAPN